MGSLNIHAMRNEYPGKSDADAAKAFAQKHGYIAIVRYKNSSSTSDYTNIGTCKTEDEIRGYLDSPYCHDPEILHHGRASEYYFLGYQRRPCQKCSGIMGITEVQSQSAVLWKCANCGYSVINYFTTPMSEDEVQRLRSSRSDGPFRGDESPAADARKAKAMEEFSEIMRQGRKKWWQFWK